MKNSTKRTITACLLGALMAAIGYGFTTLVFWIGLILFTIVLYLIWPDKIPE
jgi:hypothetical protein